MIKDPKWKGYRWTIARNDDCYIEHVYYTTLVCDKKNI